MHLDDLPEPHASRVCVSRDPAPWAARCGDPHKAQWLAWNVCQDAWYDAEALFVVRVVIDAVDRATPGLDGPDLLEECAKSLQHLRKLSEDERHLLPLSATNHVAATRFKGKYELAAESAWAEGSAPGELEPTLLAGDQLRVIPRLAVCFYWLTFNARASTVGTDPDDVVRTLGLPWTPGHGNVVRVHVPLDVLCKAGARIAIPTIFDGIDFRRPPQFFEWRARPEHEHRPGEPWGHARDMRNDGPGLPEVIADITAATRMDAEILGTVTLDWSIRPFFTRSAPR